MTEERNRGGRALWTVLCVLLTLGAAVCLWRWYSLGRGLLSQQAAERWQGENTQSYAQVSCFAPESEPFSKNRVYGFRSAIGDALKKASMDTGEERLWRDAWCAVDTLSVAGGKAVCDAEVYAVGGDFFSFHPLRLFSGDYLHEDDLMQDRVLLDLELAWRLFGSADLQGMEVKIDGHSFYVAGVVEREQDPASLLANTAEQTIYMNWEAYAALTETDRITAYEFLLPEPVEGFALQTAADKFALDRAVAVANTGRFTLSRLYEQAKSADERVLQTGGLRLPYWENAARVTESRCIRLLISAALLLLLPLISLIVGLRRLLGKGKEAFAERLFPRMREGVSEFFRRPARRRWEKKHPGEK